MILAISHADDLHAAAVLEVLERRGQPAALLDIGQFPSNGTVIHRFADDDVSIYLETDGRSLDLGKCGAIWWRRPQPFTLDEGLAPSTSAFAYAECHEAVAGLWQSLPASWVNKPELDEIAHHKPYQLTAARRAGLKIPRTLITNSPENARAFIDELGIDRTVYKTFLASEDHWRETRLLRSDELELLDTVRLAPVIFQEFVPAIENIRATVIGSTLLAAAINANPDGYTVDYRMDMDNATFKPTRLSAATERAIASLMADLGLRYGAIDLLRRADGTEVFLEINPAGEWLFVEERTGQPITQAVADHLAQLDRASGDPQ